MTSAAHHGEVTVVCGAPASGKTTYVQEHYQPGRDLILDLDRLWVALTGLSFFDRPKHLLGAVIAARDGILEWLEAQPSVSAWVIATAPRPEQRDELERQLCAKVIVLEVPPSECSKRIRSDPKRADDLDRHELLVRQWWESYHRRPTDWINGQQPDEVSEWLGQERKRRDKRQSSAKRGYDRQWRNLRARILARDPVCQICGLEPSTHVDHITPKPAGTDDPSNLRGCCLGCHNRRHIRRGDYFGRRKRLA